MAGQSLNGPFDVLGLGIVTVDDLLYVPEYPTAESKIRVRASLRQCGGLTGTALVAAARLGARCAYAGALGQDDLSSFFRRTLQAEGIDLSDLDPARESPPIHSTIVVDESAGTRTIFFELPEGLEFGGAWPPEESVRSSRVLFIDHYDADRTIRAARIARGAGIPVVADFERDDGPRFAELFPLADHLILSRDFAAKLTGEADPARAVDQLWSWDRAVVVVTGGADGCWYSKQPGAPVSRHPAFPVRVVDTTGCGDVFHGAYAASLARGEPLADRIRFAAASAALKATKAGGQSGIPDQATVEAFLKAQGS